MNKTPDDLCDEKYVHVVFVDVEKYSKRKPLIQLKVVKYLNQYIEDAIKDLKLSHDPFVLPTGDGAAIVFVHEADVGTEKCIDFSLILLNKIREQACSSKCKEFEDRGYCNCHNHGYFNLRIGIAEGFDIVYCDYNKKLNVAGAHINEASRIMNLADRNQILVSREVYNNIIKNIKYNAKQFSEYSVIIKHGEEIKIFQYMDKDNHNLNNSIPVELDRSTKLLNNAELCGLTRVYRNRWDASLDKGHDLSDIKKAIQQAEKRVWMSGVAFKADITLESIVSEVPHKIRNSDGLRILLLDALRSPAIFRSFLETDSKIALDLIEQDRSKLVQPNDPYFNQSVYPDFYSAYAFIHRNKYLHDNVRYYAQNPNCWMIIIDNTAFYEPYTFGNIKSNHKNCIGHLMPVFQFILKDGKNNAFPILEDHFDKLWRTSNHDHFHMQARMNNRFDIIKKIFQNRLPWFRYIYGSLHKGAPCIENNNNICERRRNPRLCNVKEKCEITINGTKQSYTIIDYSSESLGIEIESKINLIVNDEVEIEIPSKGKLKNITYSALTSLLKKSKKFLVVRKMQTGRDSDNKWQIGLRLVDPQQQI